MLELVRKNNLLYVKALMKLGLTIQYQNKVFDKKERTELLLPEEVMYILTRNGNIRLFNGEKFIKLNLGQFYDVMKRKDYKIVDYVEPKKEEPKQQPKVEPKKEEVKEQPKVEPKKEEPKQEVVEQVEEPKQEQQKQQNDNNKKQRHNNNHNNNKAGDK